MTKSCKPYIEKRTIECPIYSFNGISVIMPEDTHEIGVARKAYNVEFFGRNLLPGYGTVGLAIGTGSNIRSTVEDLVPERIWRWQVVDQTTGDADDRIVVWRSRTATTNAGAVYYIRLRDGIVHDSTLRILTDINCTMNYRFDSKDGFFMFLSNGTTKALYEDSSIVSYSHQEFSDVLFYQNKFFAVLAGTESKLFYNSNISPAKWTADYDDYGYVDLKNESKSTLRRIMPLKENVYAFSDYGITRLTMYTDRNYVKDTNVASFRGKLLPDTICLCGEVIIFATTAGVIEFDGFNMRKIYDYATPLVLGEEGEPTAYFYDDKYYLACRIDRDGDYMGDEVGTGYVNNAVFVMDLLVDKISISRGFDIRSFYEIDYDGKRHLMVELYTKNIGKLAEFRAKIGKNLGASVKKYWQSPYTDFCELNAKKIIRSISIRSPYGVTVSVNVDGEKYNYPVVGAAKSQKLIINKSCDKFSIALSTSSQDFEIGSLAVDIDIVRKYNGQQ